MYWRIRDAGEGALPSQHEEYTNQMLSCWTTVIDTGPTFNQHWSVLFAESASPSLTSQLFGSCATFYNHEPIVNAVNLQLIHTPLLIFKGVVHCVNEN